MAQFSTFLAQAPPPPLARPNAAPPHHHHLIYTIPPPSPITLHPHFQRRTRNRAPAARFSTFCLQPSASLSFREPAAPLPLPPCTSLPTTSLHSPLPSFPMACLNSSPGGLVSRFWFKPTASLSFHKPATLPPLPPHTHLPTASPHGPPPSFPMACPKSSPGGSVSIFWPKPTASLSFREPTTLPPLPPQTHLPTTSSHGPPLSFPMVYPKLSPGGSVLRFWPKSTTPLLISQTRDPATVTTLHAPPHYLPTPPSTVFSNGVPKIEPRWLDFGFWAQTPPPLHNFFPPVACYLLYYLHHSSAIIICYLVPTVSFCVV